MTSGKSRRVPLVTLLLFVAACGLLLFSTVGGARAALTYGSSADAYKAQIEFTPNAALSIGRSGEFKDVEDSATTRLVPGKNYDEAVTVSNGGSAANGDIDKYVRLVVYKYWKDGENKATDLDPTLISVTQSGSSWLRDTAMSTDEREIFYYPQPIAPGASTAALELQISVDGSVVKLVEQTPPFSTSLPAHTTITTSYVYDGKTVCIEIEADGVQTHHAQDAIMSAWGRAVTVSDGGPLALS